MPTLPSKRRSLRFGKESTPRTSIKPTGSVPDLQHLSLHSFFKKRHSTSSSHNNNNIDTNKNNNNNNETMKESQRVNGNNHDLTTSTNTTPSIIPSSSSSSSSSEKVDPSQILKGVIACLDIRTEDGDDVSQSFERSLQSMGAKTRRTFSDSITHLIYKNGSTATLRKALGKKVVIVNLLWITRCKTEGKRLNEKEFLIERPQGIIMSAKKRRKSMEPGKVKALEMDASAKRELLLDNESKRKRQRSDNVSEPRTRRLSEKRNHIHHSALMDSSTWKAEDIPSTSSSSSSRDSHTDEEDEILGDKKSSVLHDVDDTMSITNNGDNDNKGNDKQQHIRRRLSLIPSTSTTTANNKRRESALFTPEMRERSNQIKAQIKADFFIQDADSSSSASSSPKPSSSRLSLGSSSNTPPLKRKRRSMGPNNIHKAPITSSISTTATTTTTTPTTTFNNNSNVISTIASSSSASTPTPMKSVSLKQKPITITKTKKMIVMTGMTQQLRDTCTKIIRKLGIYEIGTFVDSRTTHVIVGSKRRTESVLSGMALKLWLVTPDWILKSGEAEKYLEEIKYEATKFFTRVSISRTSNKQLLPSNIHICIHSVHALTKESMEQLVLRANGQIVHSLREADIVISKTPLDTDKVVVNENWLFYCIEQWKYLPFDKFTLKK